MAKPFICPCCGATYTLAEAVERRIGDRTYDGLVLLYWNCTCTATMTIRLVPAPVDVLARLGLDTEEAA